jgi:hypothetical protein
MKRQLTASEVQDVLQRLDSYLSDLKSRWDKENPGNRSWFTIPRNYILKGTAFIVNILDELITFVEPIIPNGSDKKAAVLAICSKLFDYIAVQSFPFWLKPFSKAIKEIAVGILLGHLIDFIVNKYNSGYWSMTQEATNGTTDQVA